MEQKVAVLASTLLLSLSQEERITLRWKSLILVSWVQSVSICVTLILSLFYQFVTV